MADTENREDQKISECLREAFGYSDDQLLKQLDQANETFKDVNFTGAEDRLMKRFLTRYSPTLMSFNTPTFIMCSLHVIYFSFCLILLLDTHIYSKFRANFYVFRFYLIFFFFIFQKIRGFPCKYKVFVELKFLFIFLITFQE